MKSPSIDFLQMSPNEILEGYSIAESSSGEFHLFSSFVGFMASIKLYSLILIDEPEISLHPNWANEIPDIFARALQGRTLREFACNSSDTFPFSPV